MRCTRLPVVLLVLATSPPSRALAQVTASHEDSILYRVLARIGEDNPRTVRIANHESVRVQGRGLRLLGDSVVVVSHQKEYAIAVVDVDSLWVQRGTAALVLGAIAAAPCALYLGLAFHSLATGPDGNRRGEAGPVAALVGGLIGGVACGAVGAGIGSFIRLWRLEYARPLKEVT